jgi:hypothetical protein
LKKYPLKKAKENFIYDIHSNKFYDFRSNTNIAGFSHKRLTTFVKDNVSSAWNIKDNSIHHNRFKKQIEQLFGENFILKSSHSIEEFFSRLILTNPDIDFTGKNQTQWLKEKHIITENNSNSKKIFVIDMAELFLESGENIEMFNENISKIKHDGIVIFNYFWFPLLEISTTGADIIILPELYSGNFGFVNVLVKENNYNFLNEFENIPSLFASSALKNYFVIKSCTGSPEGRFNLLNKNFKVSGRIFIPENLAEIENLTKIFEEKNILINNKPPFYNYLPINLEEYQIKYLKKVFEC